MRKMTPIDRELKQMLGLTDIKIAIELDSRCSKKLSGVIETVKILRLIL